MIYLRSIFSKVFFLFILVWLHAFNIKTFAQDELVKTVKASLDQYNSNSLQEKVYVHTDKNFYLAGDIIWFKIYYVDAFFNKPLHLSKVAYVDILDNNYKPVEQCKISLKNDGGDGSIQLPLTVASGNYKLRAYTHWMKNFGAEIFFEKDITIINTLKNADTPIQPAIEKSYMVNFFPEGGNLVKGLESKVAFKITNAFGDGVDGQGQIVDENNVTIVNFKPSKYGIGSFKFKPMPNQKYKAIITMPDGSFITQMLPNIYDQGYVMSVSEEDNQYLKIQVQTNTLSGSPYAQNIYLLVHKGQALKIAEKTAFNNSTALFVIDKNKLGNGINQLTIFNADKQPLCERLYFLKPSNQTKLTVATDKDQYTTRQKINISVTAKDSTGKNMPANLSISVFKLDSLQSISAQNIQNYLWLTSELAGKVESPDYYFSSNNQEVLQALDNLMLSHGWRRFKWDHIFLNEKKTYKYLPEIKGHIVTVKIINASNRHPAKDVVTFLSIPGYPFHFQTSKSNDSGLVHFDVESYGAGEIFLQANTENGRVYQLNVLSPFAESYSTSAYQVFKLPASETLLTNYNINMQTQHVYTADSLRKFRMPLIKDSLPFYGMAPYSYLLDNYTRFTTVEEVLREYVRPVNVILKNGKPYLRIIDEARKEYNEEGLLVLLDGIPLFDKQQIFGYDPLKIKRIDVIPGGYFMGPANFKGIASFVTYNGNYEGLELNKSLVSINYEGLQLQREFYSPVYENQTQVKSRIPDFRTTLYWAPNFKTAENNQTLLNFYTSDRKGTYMIVVEGLDGNGNAISANATFSIK